MGDAGPSQPIPKYEPFSLGRPEHETTTREITVLVTGFGPFKNFTTNPSFLIASALPHLLPPQKPSAAAPEQTLPPTPAAPPPYTIRLLVHPSPIRVSYATIASLIPTLLQQHNPDYIFHIGVAGGRTNYTLETLGHRDNYKIKDVDERDGWKEGEFAWKRDGVPQQLHVGWDEEDVADRWQREVWDVEHGLGLLDADGDVRTAAGGAAGTGASLTVERFGEWARPSRDRTRTKSRCQLSVDAGRFLCEFTLFESLAQRWLEMQHAAAATTDLERCEIAMERLGKVAFLHVPGGFDEEAVERGARVAIAAIRSLVGSWEAGRRRKDGQEASLIKTGKLETGQWHGVVWKG